MDFCKLIQYFAAFLKLSMISGSFLAEILGFLLYSNILSAYGSSLTSFPICTSLIFFFFPHCSSLVLWIQYCKKQEQLTAYLELHFRGTDSCFSPFKMKFSLSFSHAVFIMGRYAPFNPTLLRTFIMKTIWFLSKAFFCVEMTI